ncbi:MAG: flagellar basal body-associated FliL family protein [Paracoccaceae bacterium]
MRALLAVVMISLGIGLGLGLGSYLRSTEPSVTQDSKHTGEDEGKNTQDKSTYFTIDDQIIVPIVDDGKTKALMLFELALEIPDWDPAFIRAQEPKLRDSFLRELLFISHTGAFSKKYTNERVIEKVKRKLLAAARYHLGRDVKEILILDFLRQDF